MKTKTSGTELTRRELVGVLGGAAAGLLLVGCEGTSTGTVDAAAGTPDGSGACTVYPQETQGPYYLDLNDLRSDITEGKPGAPLAVVIEVLDASGGCSPIANAAVDIWHCDAAGVYSGYPGQLGGLDTTGQTFLRGTQVTGADGKATFATIYPGWYPGRTTHIHVMVHLTSTTHVTSQLYFPEPITATVYGTGAYASHGQKDTTNAGDGAAAGNLPPLCAVTGDANGYTATITFTVA